MKTLLLITFAFSLYPVNGQQIKLSEKEKLDIYLDAIDSAVRMAARMEKSTDIIIDGERSVLAKLPESFSGLKTNKADSKNKVKPDRVTINFSSIKYESGKYRVLIIMKITLDGSDKDFEFGVAGYVFVYARKTTPKYLLSEVVTIYNQ